jgi:hypothetical protein
MGDINPDKHWSRMDIADLRWQASFGDTIVQIARFLNRSEADVREKAEQLGVSVKEGRGRRPSAASRRRGPYKNRRPCLNPTKNA